MILYEYPFNERIRTYLRLEHLFLRLSTLMAREDPLDHHFAIASMFEVMDVGARAEIHALIRGLSAQGCAVILASSDLPELLGLSHRVLIQQDGRQAALIDRAGLTADQLLARVYSPNPA